MMPRVGPPARAAAVGRVAESLRLPHGMKSIILPEWAEGSPKGTVAQSANRSYSDKLSIVVGLENSGPNA